MFFLHCIVTESMVNNLIKVYCLYVFSNCPNEMLTEVLL